MPIDNKQQIIETLLSFYGHLNSRNNNHNPNHNFTWNNNRRNNGDSNNDNNDNTNGIDDNYDDNGNLALKSWPIKNLESLTSFWEK